MEDIICNRLIIRRFKESDWEDLYEYLSNPEVVKFEPYYPYTEDQAKQEAKLRAENKDFYAVCLKDTGKLIGNLYFTQYDFDTWEIGYVFNDKYHHKGYAFESAHALMNHAFSNLGARRIIAVCSTLNTASWRLMERLKMRREGLLRQNVYFKTDSKGKPIWYDSYEYAILKHEWK